MDNLKYPKNPSLFLTMLALAVLCPGPKFSLSFSALHQHISKELDLKYSKDALLHAIYSLESCGSLTLDECPTLYQKGAFIPDQIVFSSVQKGVNGLIHFHDEIVSILAKIGGY